MLRSTKTSASTLLPGPQSAEQTSNARSKSPFCKWHFASSEHLPLQSARMDTFRKAVLHAREPPELNFCRTFSPNPLFFHWATGQSRFSVGVWQLVFVLCAQPEDTPFSEGGLAVAGSAAMISQVVVCVCVCRFLS